MSNEQHFGCGIVRPHRRWAEPRLDRIINRCSSRAPAFILALLAALLVPVVAAAQPRFPSRETWIGELQDRNERCVERRVETPDELESVLRSDFVGCVIVTKDKFLNMTGRSSIPVNSGVALIGERGEIGSRPSIFTDAKCADLSIRPGSHACQGYALFLITGNGISVSGLHLRGPAKGDRSSEQPYVHGIKIVADPDQKTGRNIYIADNEFDEWTGAGIDISSTHVARTPQQFLPEWTRMTQDDAKLILVEGNFMHHNARDGGGYGVVVGSGAFATILGNVFDFNRHAVASDGFANSGYISKFNYVLEGGFKQGSYYNQHFDVHGTNDSNGDDRSTGYGGTAGEFYEISHNTIRGDQNYYCFIACLNTRPALMLRGRPTTGLKFDANILAHDDLDAAVSLKDDKGDTGWGEDHGDFNFSAAGNQYNKDYSNELATGDFDGDKRTDIFIATGTAWFYSRGGQGPWEFLQASNKRISELGLADIDNDGITDVLYRDGAGNVGFLKSGRIALRPLTTSPVPMSEMRFGDFDGDGLTDIFYTRDGQWRIWYGNLKEWRDAQNSGFPISALLFGEFDAVKGTDVAAVTGGKWQISSAALSSWTVLNPGESRSFRGAVVADFNGDGRDDIAFDEGRQMWSYSAGGAGPLLSLREGDGQFVHYPELSKLLAGRFDGDPRAEIVSYYVRSGENLPVFENHFMIWRGGVRDRFEQLSLHPMR